MKLSFCIPTYNRAEYLRRCLESVVSITDPDIEIIVQDNCSPDATQDVVRSFSDNRIRYFRNSTNIGGVLNAIDIIGKASGDYIFYVTDDDYLLPGVVPKIRRFIEVHNPAFITSDVIVFLEKQRKARNHSCFMNDVVCGAEDVEAVSKIFLSASVLTRVCFRKDLLDLEFLKEHGNNWYPQMLIALMLCNKGPLAYHAEPLSFHTWENETFWGMDHSNTEALNQGVVNIIKIAGKDLDYVLLERIIYHFSVTHCYLSRDLLGLLTPKDRIKVKIVTCFQKLKIFILSNLEALKHSILAAK